MTTIKLKSTEFRRERERSWRDLEVLLGKAERRGLRSLSAAELLRLPTLYRATLSGLSVARSISLDRSLLMFLESLSARAYFLIYGARTGALEGVLDFLTSGFPRAVRAARWHILVSGLTLALGMIVGFVLTLGNADWFYTLSSLGPDDERTPTATTEFLRAGLYDDGGGAVEQLSAFASFLFTHNAAIGMFAFALGFALGVPTLLLLFANGLSIGAFAALYESRGLSGELWAWLSIHGATELLAIVLCGGAGLVLGASVAFPGRHSRLDNLARNGRLAAQVIIGGVVMFFIAALLEGFGRQLILSQTVRYTIATGSLLFWGWYFVRVGRAK